MRIELEPLGDRAILARFAAEDDAARFVAAVRAKELRGVTDVVLAYRSAAVFADPDQADLDALESALLAIEPGSAAAVTGKLVTIPVFYDGPDLSSVAYRLGLEINQVIEHHSSVEYQVFAIGFLPGFPYAGYLRDELCGLPRRDEPRLIVPAGAVAVAGRQTGIYPKESPGGWHVLGRTPLRIADADTGHFPIRAGDRIRFQAIGPREFEVRRDERL
jgi:KipI family sensor histidine kinase inhibitor